MPEWLTGLCGCCEMPLNEDGTCPCFPDECSACDSPALAPSDAERGSE